MWGHGGRVPRYRAKLFRVSFQGPAEVSKVSCVSGVCRRKEKEHRRHMWRRKSQGTKENGNGIEEMTNFLLPKFLLYKSLPYCPFYR